MSEMSCIIPLPKECIFSKCEEVIHLYGEMGFLPFLPKKRKKPISSRTEKNVFFQGKNHPPEETANPAVI